jgi:GTPase SAR1 family protein
MWHLCLRSAHRLLFFQTQWVPELKHHCVSAHTIVVGTKTDLRSDPARKVGQEKVTSFHFSNSFLFQAAEAEPFTKEDGERLARDVGARMYVECSSFTQDGLKNVFEQAVRVALSGAAGSSGGGNGGGAGGTKKGPCAIL